jgi:hypothetical protein
MKLDVKTVRLLDRLTDRMNLIRKNPHRYEIDDEVQKSLAKACEQVETLLATIRVIKAG